MGPKYSSKDELQPGITLLGHIQLVISVSAPLRPFPFDIFSCSTPLISFLQNEARERPSPEVVAARVTLARLDNMSNNLTDG